MTVPTERETIITSPPSRRSALAGMPDAQALVVELAAAAGHPSAVAVVGVGGSGKSIVLQAIARALDDDVMLVDDAHRLDDETLRATTTAVTRGEVTVAVACEPRDHHPALDHLLAAVRGRGRVLMVAPLTTSGVVARSGHQILAASAAAVVTDVAGNREVIDAVIAAVGERADDATDLDDLVRRTINGTLHRRIRRLDPTVLVALVIAGTGAGLDIDTVAQTAAIDTDAARHAIDEARGSGVLDAADALVPAAASVLDAVLGSARRAELDRMLISVQRAHRTLTADRALAAAEAGMVDGELAQALTEFAAAARGHRAVLLWQAARAAGATDVDRALASAALAADELEIAEQVADEAMQAGTPEREAIGVHIAAAVAMRRGNCSRAVQLFRWLGVDRIGADAARAVVAAIATGDRHAATEFLAATGSAPPTAENAAAELIARGLLDSVDAAAGPALGAVLRAVSMRGGSPMDPEGARGVAVAMCLHGGDLDGARAVLDRSGGDGETSAVQNELMRAWVAMAAGDLTEAAARAGSVTATVQRDALVAHALTVGIARRRGDSGALAQAWRDAAPVVAEAQADLFTLLALGELWLAAIRCDDVGRMSHLVADAGALLAALGDPPSWAAAWHWYGVQAALLADRPDDLVPHARALGAAAGASSYAATLAQAGRVWLRVRQGVDADPPVSGAEIDSAARSLERVGLAFDGARLAAEGALRVDDTADATSLLQTARSIGSAPSSAASATGLNLSERESEVAQQLVLGLTYREIGAVLYISAKTVEHHVARIRRRLDARSRSELLSILRAAGYGDPDRTP
ncbi:LuxR C-terminal-related transcriptional regulator [Williamsia sp. CHRR-6]|uniref:LuxR C-terminal-related transcriptional regulator n=1 Tax=Williamsia sp. CHRR-6 TaxID=2835871 RepID=UPI001BDB5E2F|nr:LuxR C-terminal-related transcriptional regulator [Williamsia sp. CHRR-6]MBT0566246.1 helix-turn-helix transcriptional regulator [Williamsia sp. CHRR-6]